MGITDEDYADALVYEEQRQAQFQQMKRRMAPNDASVLKNTPAGVKVIDEKDLQHEAMKAPLSALVDMWTVRWSGEWVNEGEFVKDDFWRLAFIRLVGANKLEKHSLANQYESVYRIIE
jgi:hypothetical protein